MVHVGVKLSEDTSPKMALSKIIVSDTSVGENLRIIAQELGLVAAI